MSLVECCFGETHAQKNSHTSKYGAEEMKGRCGMCGMFFCQLNIELIFKTKNQYSKSLKQKCLYLNSLSKAQWVR